MATTKNEPGTIWSEGPCSLHYLFSEMGGQTEQSRLQGGSSPGKEGHLELSAGLSHSSHELIQTYWANKLLIYKKKERKKRRGKWSFKAISICLLPSLWMFQLFLGSLHLVFSRPPQTNLCLSPQIIVFASVFCCVHLVSPARSLRASHPLKWLERKRLVEDSGEGDSGQFREDFVWCANQGLSVLTTPSLSHQPFPH